jgi:hypothetical protein
MRTRIIGALLASAAALATAGTASAEDGAVFGRLIEQKAGPVVSVKAVLHVKFSFRGQSQEQEVNATSGGIAVNNAGLVMVPASAFDVNLGGRGRRGGMDINVTPSNIRVVFPGDTTEYPSILGAKDSKLGLAFVLIKDLAGKKDLKVLDLEQTVEPKVGDTLYTVRRLGQGFDYAPMCSRVRIAGTVTKPRSMWIVEGAGNDVAMPVYSAEGAVAGIVVSQTGVGEDAATRPFLLPLKVATPTVGSALKKAQEELEAILEAEEEKAEAEAEEKAKEEAAKKEEDAKKEGEGDGKDGDGDGRDGEGDK